MPSIAHRSQAGATSAHAAKATGEGSDNFADVENVTGSQLFGDRLSGAAGANVLEGPGGADELRGGDGSDTVSYAGAAGPVTVDLARITQSGGERLNSIENAAGSPFADLLTGNAVATLAGAKRQRLVRQGAIRVRVQCPLEDCTAVASASGGNAARQTLRVTATR